jgi:hypothetical protein
VNPSAGRCAGAPQAIAVTPLSPSLLADLAGMVIPRRFRVKTPLSGLTFLRISIAGWYGPVVVVADPADQRIK